MFVTSGSAPHSFDFIRISMSWSDIKEVSSRVFFIDLLIVRPSPGVHKRENLWKRRLGHFILKTHKSPYKYNGPSHFSKLLGKHKKLFYAEQMIIKPITNFNKKLLNHFNKMMNCFILEVRSLKFVRHLVVRRITQESN